jgi:hypothetical protein
MVNAVVDASMVHSVSRVCPTAEPNVSTKPPVTVVPAAVASMSMSVPV